MLFRSRAAERTRASRSPAGCAKRVAVHNDDKIPELANSLVSSRSHTGVGARCWNRRNNYRQIGRRSPRSGFFRGALLRCCISSRRGGSDFDAPIPRDATRGENRFSMGLWRYYPHAVAGGNHTRGSSLASKGGLGNMGGADDDRERRLGCSFGRSEKESQPLSIGRHRFSERINGCPTARSSRSSAARSPRVEATPSPEISCAAARMRAHPPRTDASRREHPPFSGRRNS